MGFAVLLSTLDRVDDQADEEFWVEQMICF